MSSNFDFLNTDFPDLHKDIVEAEQLVYRSPKASAVLSRSVLEQAVHYLYQVEGGLTLPYRTELNALLHHDAFKALFNRTMFNEINLIRKLGNHAAHASAKNKRRTTTNDALTIIKYQFRFLRFLAIYYGKTEPQTQAFDQSLIINPNDDASHNANNKAKGPSQAEFDQLLQSLEQKTKALADSAKARVKQSEENQQLKLQIAQQHQATATRKLTREQTIDSTTANPALINEAQTRELYIDIALKEAGWHNLTKGKELEYPVVGMPHSTNPSGEGEADYVLWDNNGLPLAVIEAKKAMASPKKGKHQAVLYADCLTQMTGRRPIIFYTNGFETFLWDDQFAPERQVQGFYTKDELRLLIARRDTRQDLRKFKVNLDIAGKGRPYQLEAIKRVAENTVKSIKQKGQQGNSIEVLRSGARQSLLVMATGSGKTRVAAAITDMMVKYNWAKRVLFLADRNALVTQAKGNFNRYLPHLTAIDLTKEKQDLTARIVFSTYPTMMNRIDKLKDNNERGFGVGHFDLIIIDEAHRSVYQKYKAIFDYFDALLIGLTATPKKDIGRDTYALFNIEDDNPTFFYELDQAVKEGFLVPAQAMSVPLKFVRDGVKYAELKEHEKKEYELKFGDPTCEAPDEIANTALNDWLFNTNTIDSVLAHLMTNGIKIEGGDKLGKTIIFAKNHRHASFIEERFNKQYSEYAGKFLRVIDNYESKAQDLLETFVNEYQDIDPQIAVSVDMMDTGVDAPRVVNLVFFKQIKSSSKFWQMVGRGTRLCEGLFGLNEDGNSNDKTHFTIFDYCENLEYFSANPEGATSNVAKSLSQQIFEAKLDIAHAIRKNTESTDEQRTLAEGYIKTLHLTVSNIDTDKFAVRIHLNDVLTYSDEQRWLTLNSNDIFTIKETITPHISPTLGDDELARRFDVLVLNYQLQLASGSYGLSKQATKINDIANSLLKIQHHPEVKPHVEFIKQITTETFWQNITINKLDDIRLKLRGLIQHIEKDVRAKVYTSFTDTLDEDGIKTYDLTPSYTSMQSYKSRVAIYVRNNRHHIVIEKLKTNKPITQSEIDQLEGILFDNNSIGSKQDYQDNYGDKPLGEFIRSILGLDESAARSVFADFIQAGHLSANQMTFIDGIIQYLTKNGTIDTAMLYEKPFTNIHDGGLDGLFEEEKADTVVNLIEQINHNALAS